MHKPKKIIVMNYEKERYRVSEKSTSASSIKLISIAILLAWCNMIVLPFATQLIWVLAIAFLILPLSNLLVEFRRLKLFTGSVIILLIVLPGNSSVAKQNMYLPSQFTHQSYNQPQPATWRYLGEKVISFSTEKDLIHVKKVGVFRKLKFKVMDAPVKIGSMQVAFENGEVQNISLLLRVGEGRESKVIDLTETDASIKVVYFSYRPEQQGDKRKPTIILLGQQ